MANKKIGDCKVRGDIRVIRMELWFTPLLILLPIVVSIFLIRDWFYRGFSMGVSTYDGELFLAVIILVGNIIFDTSFLKSLISSNS